MSCDNEFWQKRIDATLAAIEAYENAIDAVVGANAVQSYTLDTGQSRQTVTKADVDRLQEKLDSLYNRYDMLCTRKNGSGAVNVSPLW